MCTHSLSGISVLGGGGGVNSVVIMTPFDSAASLRSIFKVILKMTFITPVRQYHLISNKVYTFLHYILIRCNLPILDRKNSIPSCWVDCNTFRHFSSLVQSVEAKASELCH